MLFPHFQAIMRDEGSQSKEAGNHSGMWHHEQTTLRNKTFNIFSQICQQQDDHCQFCIWLSLTPAVVFWLVEDVSTSVTIGSDPVVLMSLHQSQRKTEKTHEHSSLSASLCRLCFLSSPSACVCLSQRTGNALHGHLLSLFSLSIIYCLLLWPNQSQDRRTDSVLQYRHSGPAHVKLTDWKT